MATSLSHVNTKVLSTIRAKEQEIENITWKSQQAWCQVSWRHHLSVRVWCGPQLGLPRRDFKGSEKGSSKLSQLRIHSHKTSQDFGNCGWVLVLNSRRMKVVFLETTTDKRCASRSFASDASRITSVLRRQCKQRFYLRKSYRRGLEIWRKVLCRTEGWTRKENSL